MSDNSSCYSDESEYLYSDEEMSDQEEDMSLSYEDDDDCDKEKKHFGGRRSASLRMSDGNPNAAPVRNNMSMDVSSSPCGIRMVESAELYPIMKERVDEVTEVLGVPASAAAILLREHQWVKERLFETYYEDPERVQEKCGVRARCVRCPPAPSVSTVPRECRICTETRTNMLSAPCGHEFCTDCWGEFVRIAVADGPSCVRVTCPQSGCSEAVTEEEVRAASPRTSEKYRAYQLRSFVESNGAARWCPGPGCTRVAVCADPSSLSGSAAVARCSDGGCGTEFCVRCGLEPHAPTTCKELSRWQEKCRNESETANWILANTKPCPKCSSRIEKNQGCNHMTCQRCKHEFCWICMRAWSEHGANTGGYYKCNKFDADGADNDDGSDAARAKRELDRYLHYYKRYHAHSEAQKFAQKQLADTEARMIVLQESASESTTWTDVEFLKTAVEQLIVCRRVLKYTYTFAYYLTDKSKQRQRETFEHHQEMLEKFTEKLSELSEKPLAEMDRTDVVNQTRVVDRFMKNILKYVEDGMDSDKEDQTYAGVTVTD